MKKQNIVYIIFIVVIIVLLICINETKQDELDMANVILEEKFYLGMHLMYPCEPYFCWAEETTFVDDWGYREIIDYDYSCDQYLTPNAKDYLDKNGCCLVWMDGKPYIAEGGGGFSGFGGVRFEDITKTENTIEADAIQTRLDMDGKFEEEWKMKFRVKKIDGIWKIDVFADVDDVNAWEKI